MDIFKISEDKRKQIKETLQEEFPIGTRVKLVEMIDPQAPEVGSLGTVNGIDDICSILVKWDSGSSLNVLYRIDKVEKL